MSPSFRYPLHSYAGSAWTDKDYATDFLDFINSTPTEFHATEYLRKVLDNHGFMYLPERGCSSNCTEDVDWTENPEFIDMVAGKGGKFYTVRNGSAIVAGVVGPDWKPGKGGIGLVGAHIDAVTAKLKPVSIVSTSSEGQGGYLRLGVAPYSSGLSEVWLDRDLGLAGRVIVTKSGSDSKSGGTKGNAVEARLCKFEHPIGRIPSLAPHFGEVATKPYNLETQMVPIIGLESTYETQNYDMTLTEDEKKSPMAKNHDIRVLRAVAKNVGVSVGQIQQLELELYSFQGGQIGGLEGDFLFAPRLDDKLCVYTSLHGLLQSVPSVLGRGSDAKNRGVANMVAFFDNEEIGSLTRQGARGTLFQAVVERLVDCYEGSNSAVLRETYANSFFVSADTTHAVNPNFSDVYLDHHKPKLNTGITIKFNSNMANTTDSISSSLIQEICRLTDNKYQYFHIRNDSRSGGTIGPALSSATGMRSLDVGIPQLSMHSIRATTGVKDPALGVKFFAAFFEKWAEVDQSYLEGGL